jgi:sugar lactone lactonase YvrE
VRRMLGLCAVAVTVCAAMALFARAQSGAPTQSTIEITGRQYPMLAQYVGSSTLPQGPLTVIDSAAPPRAIAVGATEVLAAVSRADFPNRVIRPGLTASNDPYATDGSSFFSYVAGTGEAGFRGDGGLATEAELDMSFDLWAERSGIAVAVDGTLYIADTKNGTIRAVAGAASSEPGIIRSVVGKWAAAQNVALVEPMGIAVDRAGNLYIADHSAGTVSVLTKATERLKVLAHVASPASLAVTTDGTKVFVASPDTGGVFAITTLNGSIKTVPGFAPAATESEDANSEPCPALNGKVSGAEATAKPATGSGPVIWVSGARCPAGLAVDGRGNLFVADGNGGKILRVDATSGKTTDAAIGLIAPGDIAFDSHGDLFVSEQGRSRIIVLGQLGDAGSNLTLQAPPTPAGCPQQGAAFTYCNEPSAGTSPSFAFTLLNTSGTAVTGLTISPAFEPVGTQPPPAPTNFTTTSTSCTTTLAAGSSCVINVAFTPLAAGPIVGQLVVSDSTPSDTQTQNLAGTGDDFSLAIINGQTPEVTAEQGNTATFMAQLNADSVFGANGEKVTLACPTNLPQFTTCEFQPCPVTPTLGGATPFNILIHTSTATSETPPIPNPCNSTAAAVRRHQGGAPGGVLFVTVRPPAGNGSRFPAVLLILAATALVALGTSARGGARHAFAMLALITVGSGLVVACHKGSDANSTATPIGVTNLTVTANAVDSGGNSLRASRGLQITLDVIKATKTGL